MVGFEVTPEAQATAEFRKALESDPGFTAAEDALKRLERSAQ